MTTENPDDTPPPPDCRNMDSTTFQREQAKFLRAVKTKHLDKDRAECSERTLAWSECRFPKPGDAQ